MRLIHILNEIEDNREEVVKQPYVLLITFNNYDYFLDALKKVNDKAKKYGVPPIEILSKEKEVKNINDQKVPFYRIKLSGHPIKINGWNFLATIEHTETGGNVIRIAPGVSDSKISEYLDATNRQCDYCHTNRDRLNTYLIKNTETGEYKRVGGSCLKKYFGDAAAKLAHEAFNLDRKFYELISGISASDDDDGNFEKSMHGRNASDVDTILGIALYWINKIGYQGRNDYGKPTTADLVLDTLHPSPYTNEDDRNNINKALNNIIERKDKIEKIKNWIMNLPKEKLEASNYLFSLKTIVAADYVSNKSMGLVVSLPVAYNRAQDEEKEKVNKPESVNQYVGNIGQKIGPLKINVVGTYNGEGAYGNYQLVKMKDDLGNSYTWFNTSSNGLENDTKYEITGTVKNHQEYKGTKSTILTRVKANKID